MRILFNAVSAKMGGAANYIKSVARELAALHTEDEFIFLVPKAQGEGIQSLGGNLSVISTEAGTGSLWKRLWFDQVTIRRLIKKEKIDVLYSTANFAVFGCSCRQVLLVRNPLYFSPAYLDRIVPRKPVLARLELILRRWLNCLSIKAADVVMTPTEGMMSDVRRFVNVSASKALPNHYGVDVQRFRTPGKEADRKDSASTSYTLLFSSLYGEHKNVKTLLLALMQLTDAGFDWRLVTPADPLRDDARWTCTWREDAALVSDFPLRGRIDFTPALKAEEMPALYRSSNVFVYPSAVESFGHPLLEAMAAGLPVVAADSAVNRELAGDAALYFSAFDPADFSSKIQQVLQDAELRAELVRKGIQRSTEFSWSHHIQRLLYAFGSVAGDSLSTTQYEASEAARGA